MSARAEGQPTPITPPEGFIGRGAAPFGMRREGFEMHMFADNTPKGGKGGGKEDKKEDPGETAGNIYDTLRSLAHEKGRFKMKTTVTPGGTTETKAEVEVDPQRSLPPPEKKKKQ